MQGKRQKEEGKRKATLRRGVGFFFFLLPVAFCLRAAAQKAPPSDFIGTQECRGCHNAVFLNFEATPHWKTTFPRSKLVTPVTINTTPR